MCKRVWVALTRWWKGDKVEEKPITFDEWLALQVDAQGTGCTLISGKELGEGTITGFDSSAICFICKEGEIAISRNAIFWIKQSADEFPSEREPLPIGTQEQEWSLSNFLMHLRGQNIECWSIGGAAMLQGTLRGHSADMLVLHPTQGNFTRNSRVIVPFTGLGWVRSAPPIPPGTPS